jgi:hypothetical protein
MDVVNDSEALWWQWNGQTDVRITLVFARGASTFQHSFMFRRVKK